MELITRALAGVVAAWIPIESGDSRRHTELRALASGELRSGPSLILINKKSNADSAKPRETRL